MTKQEELREYVAKLDYKWRFCGIPDESESEWQEEGECIKQSCRAFATANLSYLHSQGVVLKVERELPPLTELIRLNANGEVINNLKQLGYEAVEPLIKGE